MPSPPHSGALYSGLRTYGPCIAGALVLLIAPYFFYPLFLAKILCFALFACAFNLLLGSCGLLSFGHAAFYGTAAYVAAHAAKEWGLPFEISIVLGMLAAGLLGAGFGYLSIRRQGLQFSMITSRTSVASLPRVSMELPRPNVQSVIRMCSSGEIVLSSHAEVPLLPLQTTLSSSTEI